jgi:CHAD domain-containing protein
MTKPDALACSYGASVLLKHLTALMQEIAGVRSAEDIESIHRMRVASRRLRSAIPLFARCFRKKRVKGWLQDIKGITRALGSARDADVQLAVLKKITRDLEDEKCKPGLRRLALRIYQKRQELQSPIIAALDKLQQDEFYTQLERDLTQILPGLTPETPFPHTLFINAASAIQERLEEFLSYEPYVHRPECVLELHAMRIAAKQLRYTMEVFASIYPGELKPYLQAVKTSQELLGDIHDCDVWHDYLPIFIEEEQQRTIEYFGLANPLNPLLPGIEYFRQNRRELRDAQYQELRLKWEQWKEKNLWDELSQRIASFIHTDLFPPIRTG